MSIKKEKLNISPKKKEKILNLIAQAEYLINQAKDILEK
jgi:hypothetical protein